MGRLARITWRRGDMHPAPRSWRTARCSVWRTLLQIGHEPIGVRLRYRCVDPEGSAWRRAWIWPSLDTRTPPFMVYLALAGLLDSPMIQARVQLLRPEVVDGYICVAPSPRCPLSSNPRIAQGSTGHDGDIRPVQFPFDAGKCGALRHLLMHRGLSASLLDLLVGGDNLRIIHKGAAVGVVSGHENLPGIIYQQGQLQANGPLYGIDQHLSEVCHGHDTA